MKMLRKRPDRLRCGGGLLGFGLIAHLAFTAGSRVRAASSPNVTKRLQRREDCLTPQRVEALSFMTAQKPKPRRTGHPAGFPFALSFGLPTVRRRSSAPFARRSR